MSQVEDLKGEVEADLDVGLGASKELIHEGDDDLLTPTWRKAEPAMEPVGIVWPLEQRPQQGGGDAGIDGRRIAVAAGVPRASHGVVAHGLDGSMTGPARSYAPSSGISVESEILQK